MMNFRNVLQISHYQISALREDQLNQLMNQLLLAQAYKCESTASKVLINTEIKSRDGGCDGWSDKPGSPDEWLGTTNTCWQFKAGKAGEPSKLKGEITKKIPRETLANGGRFVLIANGSTNGVKGEGERLQVLVDEAVQNGIPSENIEVIGSERLANWCNQNPAIAAYFTGLPNGFWTFEKWARSEYHQTSWEASEDILAELSELRKQLDFLRGGVKHLHILGLPGIGKTRYALELCRDAEWSKFVVYIPQSSEFPVNELIDFVLNDEEVRLMIVADETETNQLLTMREQIGLGNGRVRLITIGQGKSPDSVRIPSVELKPLDKKVMENIIKSWHPNMPLEKLDFVTRFADGYVRLAELATKAVVANPSMNMNKLLKQDDIRLFLDKMLGSEERYPLYVVAALTSIGWKEDMQLEGETVSRHLGLDWEKVRYTIDEYERKYRIVPQAGRFRFISPAPLAIYLASEAWNTIPDRLRTLPEVLPTERALIAYYDRLPSVINNPNVRDFAREGINCTKSYQDIQNLQNVRQWSVSSSASPGVAASNLSKVLKDTDFSERLQISGENRRLIINTLRRLAWNPISFHDSTMALGLLAEAENESWANNATGVFVECFQLYLGGTAVPYQERLDTLADIIKVNRPNLTKLVIKALSTVSNREYVRFIDNPNTGEILDREWGPGSLREHFECILLAIEQLRQIAASGNLELQDELMESAKTLGFLLNEAPLRKTVGEFFKTIRHAYPTTRESLRRIIAKVIYDDKKYFKKLTPEEHKEIEIIHKSFEDTTFEARLLQYVGVESWETDENAEIESIAKELYQNLTVFAGQWAWLTSGMAGRSWELGEELGRIDIEGKLAYLLPNFSNRGQDLRLFAAYMKIQRQELGDVWFDRWNDWQLEDSPEPATLLIEISWRCGFTEFSARKLVELLRLEPVSPQLVDRLALGTWSDNISLSSIYEIITALAESRHLYTAIGILMNRLNKQPSEIQFWDAIALKMVISPELITARFPMVSFYWKKVALTIIHSHAEEIAEAIFTQYGNNKSTAWIHPESEAASILAKCINEKPIESWNLLKPYLSSVDAYHFTSGFPRGLIDCIPPEEILKWIAEEPEEHSQIICEILTINLQEDNSIASLIFANYGDKEIIADSLISGYLPNSWIGPSSVHWENMADMLKQIASQTKLPKLKQRALIHAEKLLDRAARSRRFEEEERIP